MGNETGTGLQHDLSKRGHSGPPTGKRNVAAEHEQCIVNQRTKCKTANLDNLTLRRPEFQKMYKCKKAKAFDTFDQLYRLAFFVSKSTKEQRGRRSTRTSADNIFESDVQSKFLTTSRVITRKLTSSDQTPCSFHPLQTNNEKWECAPTWISEGHVPEFDVPLHVLQLLPAQILGVDRRHPVDHLEDLVGGSAALRKVLQIWHGLAKRPRSGRKRLENSKVIANAGVTYL